MERKLIVICGGSGAGKTTLANSLKQELKDDLAILQYDSYCVDQSNIPFEERQKVNYDLPDSYDAPLFIKHIKDLLDGKTIKKPIFDFKTHTRSKEYELVEPSKFILIEGIMVFQLPHIEDLADLLIFVSADDDIRLARRIMRDIKERGRTVESVITQYINTVKPSHYAFIDSKKYISNFIFDNNENNGIDEKNVQQLVLKIRSL